MPLSRWSSRHKKTFGEKKKEKWDGNFRNHQSQIVIILKQKVVVVGVETQY